MIRAAKYHRLWETLTNAILDVPQRRYLDEIFQAHPNLEEQLTGDNAVILQRLPQYLDISQPLPDEFDVFTPILRRLDAAMWRACQFFFDEDLDAPPPDIVNHIIVVLHHHTHLLLGLTDKLRREEIAANIVELAARNPKSRQFGQLEKFSRPSDLGVDCEELTDILTKDADRRDYPARDRRHPNHSPIDTAIWNMTSSILFDYNPDPVPQHIATCLIALLKSREDIFHLVTDELRRRALADTLPHLGTTDQRFANFAYIKLYTTPNQHDGRPDEVNLRVLTTLCSDRRS
ncbi:Hypothetical predicted protein [Cloeon dipterum]|uniref:Uncharacterized protein n=1 Tax=Cloeon dipterum TaxID=197152 RepID=A0A8S1DS19_9INSE|nr:Hypothetical predicted protein [Cloeon dipterum]